MCGGGGGLAKDEGEESNPCLLSVQGCYVRRMFLTQGDAKSLEAFMLLEGAGVAYEEVPQ